MQAPGASNEIICVARSASTLNVGWLSAAATAVVEFSSIKEPRSVGGAATMADTRGAASAAARPLETADTALGAARGRAAVAVAASTLGAASIAMMNDEDESARR